MSIAVNPEAPTLHVDVLSQSAYRFGPFNVELPASPVTGFAQCRHEVERIAGRCGLMEEMEEAEKCRKTHSWSVHVIKCNSDRRREG